MVVKNSRKGTTQTNSVSDTNAKLINSIDEKCIKNNIRNRFF